MHRVAAMPEGSDRKEFVLEHERTGPNPGCVYIYAYHSCSELYVLFRVLVR